jgi:hypothetical protein
MFGRLIAFLAIALLPASLATAADIPIPAIP